MTSDALFNRWMKRASVTFLAIFAYIMFADVAIPMTPHSIVQRPVVPVAPRVSGEVESVEVTNNQYVEKGDLLFTLDPTDFNLEVEKARLALREAQQENETLSAQLAQAQAAILEAEVNLQELQRELTRLTSLAKKELVSSQEVDRMASQVEAAKAKLTASEENKNTLQARLGKQGEQNLRLQIAHNQERLADLALSRTRVKAPAAGIVSNLQLNQGLQAPANQPLLSLVMAQNERITADFREKSLTNIDDHAKALVVFDAMPGRVFAGELVSRDYGVSQGQLTANGQLATPDDSDRWVRDAQRIRVYIKLTDHTLPSNLVTGSRATVMLESDQHGFMDVVAQVQMNIVSLLHYVY